MSAEKQLKQYTYAEVKKAGADNTRTFFVIHNKVYDVTAFLNEHPGGEEILLDHNGKDATEDFNDVGHSTDAIDLMAKYLVGEIVEAERRSTSQKEGWKAGYNTNKPEQEKYVSGPGMPFLLFAGAIILALVGVVYLNV